MKHFCLFLLIWLPCVLLGQDFNYSPNPVKDTILIQIEANYGDTLSLKLSDVVGRVKKVCMQNEITKKAFCKKDTITKLENGIYFILLSQNHTQRAMKFVGQNNNLPLNYRLVVHINPESIPTETFLLYPNPVTNGSLSLVYNAEWEQSEMTISNAMGQIVQTIAAQDGNCGDAHSLLVEGWASGLYYIRLRKNGKAITKPFWVR